MPPKNASKGGGATSKKADQKKKEKTIEDKTFGIKNKKGAKQQKFIQQVQVQVKNQGMNKEQKAKEKDREDQKKAKEDKMKAFMELNKLLKPVQVNTKGADPSTVVCAYFKQGTCTKGNKCKFSHDLSMDAKSAKRSMYHDTRENKEDETNEDWLEADLQDVIAKKHGTEATNMTRIICKHFLEAVENYKYGWFWKCVDGDSCKYRHALPVGYVLKRDRKKDEKGKDVMPIEDQVERQRAELSVETTQLTIQTFLEWKKKRLAAKAKAKKAAEAAARKTDKTSGSKISGAQLFKSSKVDVVEEGAAEEGEEGEVDLTQREEEEGEEEKGAWKNAIDYDEELRKYKEFEKQAAAEGAQQQPEGAAAADVAIDEDLFDEDLDALEEELEEMTVS